MGRWRDLPRPVRPTLVFVTRLECRCDSLNGRHTVVGLRTASHLADAIPDLVTMQHLPNRSLVGRQARRPGEGAWRTESARRRSPGRVTLVRLRSAISSEQKSLVPWLPGLALSTVQAQGVTPVRAVLSRPAQPFCHAVTIRTSPQSLLM